MSEPTMTPTEAASAVDAWRNDGDPHTPWPGDALRVLVDHARATAAPGDLAALAEDLHRSWDVISSARTALTIRPDTMTADRLRAMCERMAKAEGPILAAETALRAHRCAPAVEVATFGECPECLALLDEGQAHASSCSRTPAAPPAEGEADDATRGRAAKLPADRADDVEIALRAAMAWWEDPSDEPGSPRRVAIELADEVRRLRDASPAVEVVSGEDVHAVSRNSWVIRCHEDGTPWLNVHPMPASAAGKHAAWWRVLYSAPEPARPLAVGDTVATVEELDVLPVEAVIRVVAGNVAMKSTDRWAWVNRQGLYPADPLWLPARVLDLPTAMPDTTGRSAT